LVGRTHLGFDKSERLRRRPEFKKVERSGGRKICRLFIIYALKNELDYSRLGLTVSRKVGNSPVRNWWKRRLREVYRNNKSNIPKGFDFVVIVRSQKEKERPDFALIKRTLLKSLNEFNDHV